jgi:mRNA-degrading endonuclease toxin of MazEF toxin-antitoxin module
MVEKISSLPRSKCKRVVGRIDDAVLQQLDEALALLSGLTD